MNEHMFHNSPELVRASVEGDLATVRKLVESGADVNSTDEHGMGPLLTFTPSVTEYLLSQGADPNRQKNESGCPVLIGVAYMNNVECVRLLLEGGALPNVVNGCGETALHSSLAMAGAENVSAADRHAVVELLIQHGADPNRRTFPGKLTFGYWRDVRTRGETPLHRAAAYASEETVRFLLEAGADKTIRDANGDSPQSWASWHWRPKHFIFMLDPGEPTDEVEQPMRYEVWREIEDRDRYSLSPAGTQPLDKSELIWTFEAETWDDAKRMSNAFISALRGREMRTPDQ